MRPLWRMLIVAAVLPIGGCGGDAGSDDDRLEPGPATRGVPGAAGSMTLELWDTPPDRPLADEDFHAWDTDRDGALDLEEVRGGLDRNEVYDPDRPDVPETDELGRLWLERWDADGDGRIDAVEWGRVVAESRGDS